VNGSGKHSSLLGYVNDYSRKKDKHLVNFFGQKFEKLLLEFFNHFVTFLQCNSVTVEYSTVL
jgi:hypothetical protein